MAHDEIGRELKTGTLVDGRATVTTAGTAEAMASSSTPVQWIIIVAETNNTNPVVVGASTVVAAEATRRGTPLYTGEPVTLYQVDLANVYLDAVTSTDGVTYLYKT